MTTLCQPKVRVRQCDLFFFTSLCSAADLAAVSRRTNDAVPCGVVIMHSSGKKQLEASVLMNGQTQMR